MDANGWCGSIQCALSFARVLSPVLYPSKWHQQKIYYGRRLQHTGTKHTLSTVERERERERGQRLQASTLVHSSDWICCLVQRGLTDTDTGCSIMLRQSTTAGQRLVVGLSEISDGATLGLHGTRAGPKCAEKQAHGHGHGPHLFRNRLTDTALIKTCLFK